MINLFLAATLFWTANPEPNIAGYQVYVGVESRNYNKVVDNQNKTRWLITNVEPWTIYYLAATAYTTVGLESDFSNEKSFIDKPEYIISSNHFTFFVQPDEVLEQSYYLNTSWTDTQQMGIVDIYFNTDDKMFFRKRKLNF